jgi:ketosteroid isomerase-like protein
MNPTETVEEYYKALRRGEPLSPYFVEREDVVKFGVSERLEGYEEVAEGLREQTRTTEDWQVESQQLQVLTRESVAWFTDDVALAWTDREGTRQSFDTRWSGVLERDAGGTDGEAGGIDGDAGGIDGDAGGTDEDAGGTDSGENSADWRFAQMHVSAPHDL